MKYLLIILLFSSISFAQISMPNDSYGRTVVLNSSAGQDNYTVTGSCVVFTVSFPEGTQQSDVYNSINAQAPGC